MIDYAVPACDAGRNDCHLGRAPVAELFALALNMRFSARGVSNQMPTKKRRPHSYANDNRRARRDVVRVVDAARRGEADANPSWAVIVLGAHHDTS